MKRSRLSSIRFAIIVLVVTSSIFGAGFFVGKNAQPQRTAREDLRSLLTNPNGSVDFSLIEDVWNLINDEYVNTDKLDRQALVFGAIRGMLDAIGDPYTVFFDNKETKEFLESVSGHFEGIGTEIGIRNKQLIVIAPLKDTPASRAG